MLLFIPCVLAPKSTLLLQQFLNAQNQLQAAIKTNKSVDHKITWRTICLTLLEFVSYPGGIAYCLLMTEFVNKFDNSCCFANLPNYSLNFHRGIIHSLNY